MTHTKKKIVLLWAGLVTAMAFQIMTTNLKYATGINLNTADFVTTWVDVCFPPPHALPPSGFAPHLIPRCGIRAARRCFASMLCNHSSVNAFSCCCMKLRPHSFS